MKSRIVLLLLAVVSFLITALPASAGLLFSNGPPSGTIYGWEIDSGAVVSDSFGFTGTANLFTIALWVLPGDTPTRLDWSVTSGENSGTVYASQTYNFSAADLTLLTLKGTTFIGFGPHGTGTPCPTGGCDIYLATVNIPGAGLTIGPGTYWLNLQNATSNTGDPVGWDENDGTASFASQNIQGVIGSEDPDFYGTAGGTTPEPGSFVLFVTGAAGWAGFLRRRRKL